MSLLKLQQFRFRLVTALGAVLVCAISVAVGPSVSGTQALFVALVRNAGNTFGVPSLLAPTGVGATPLAGGSIRVQWSEPGASNVFPAATSWAGSYFIYRSQSPATPGPDAAPYATVLSSGSTIGTFIDGGLVDGHECTGTACPVNNTRYYYWVRALSRQTGFPSPLISATVSGASDALAPQVVTVSPGTLASSVPLTTNVQVTFSEPVDFDTAVAATCIAPTASPANCISVSSNKPRWAKSSGVLLELKPTSRLAPNTSYGVSFASSGTFGIRDLAGNVMPSAQASSTTSFTTETPAGTVGIRWRSPAVDAQEYMPASGPVVALTFAEPMDPTSTAGAFELFAGAGCQSGSTVATTSTWNATSNAVSFSPAHALNVGLMASPTFGVYTYSMRFNEPIASGKSIENNPASAIQCANGSFVPSTPVLAIDLADIPSGATIAEPMVVAGEPLVLRSVSGPWRQGSYSTIRALFDEPRSANVASSTIAIGGDSWNGLHVVVPPDAVNGRHFIAVQNDAISANIGQDVRTAFKAVTVVDPTISVATFGATDAAETSPRTVMSPQATSNGDTLRFRVRVTAPGRDGSGVRPVAGVSVRVRALANPVGYDARLCASLTNLTCNDSSTDLTLTTDSQGVIRGFVTAPNTGTPFNTIVLLTSAGTEWGSIVLTDPAPTPPADLQYVEGLGRFTWSASPTPGVAGYRLRLVPVDDTGAVDVVIDAGVQLSVGVPAGALVPGRAYRASVTAYDSTGRASSSSSDVSFVAPNLTATPTPTSVATNTSRATFVVTATATLVTTPATATATPSAVATATVTAQRSTATVTAVGASTGGSMANSTSLSSLVATTPAPVVAMPANATTTPSPVASPPIALTSTLIPSTVTPTAQNLPHTPGSTIRPAPTATPGSTVAIVATPDAPAALPAVIPPTQAPSTVVRAPTSVASFPAGVPDSALGAPATVPPASTDTPPSPITAPPTGVQRPDAGTSW